MTLCHEHGCWQALVDIISVARWGKEGHLTGQSMTDARLPRCEIVIGRGLSESTSTTFWRTLELPELTSLSSGYPGTKIEKFSSNILIVLRNIALSVAWQMLRRRGIRMESVNKEEKSRGTDQIMLDKDIITIAAHMKHKWISSYVCNLLIYKVSPDCILVIRT